ncbi:MAG TPA: carboxypeptidase-like regulatory domain-containing protein [Terracidiphilus sp.]|nr:carboxypeptidase-like regulatory domain-containing protein [Terracidiphilus sp.]
MRRRTVIIWTVVAVGAVTAAALIALRMRHVRVRSTTIHGAVIRRDEDARKQLPIADVVVTASNGVSSVSTRSDASGYFSLRYPQILWPGRIINLSFRHDGYMPLDLQLRSGIHLASRELYVAAMSPLPQPAQPTYSRKPSVVSNIRVRYTVNADSAINIGSAVQTFEVVNKGNVPCNEQPICSPDRNWKAARGSVSLDAGSGNVFRNVRASCIAGPCPFTKIDPSGYIHGGREITASAIDWSDTATFLVEAEVFHEAISSDVRELYPVIFGDALHFTLPPTQEGVSIEAEIDGTSMVFPLGPNLYLSWATCTMRADPDKTTIYHCELKQGFQF